MSQQHGAAVLQRVVTPDVVRAIRADRLLSLDAFRGISIAAMILVNNPGSWHDIYWPLVHANWNGCTPADLIFPFFLFIVGVAITFSFSERQRRGSTRRQLIIQILRRTLIIFALGLFLTGFPYFDWTSIRIPGVLQRIALCYCAAALIVLAVGTEGQAFITLLLIVGYWVLMKWVPLPRHPAGGLGPGKNLAAYIDLHFLRDHMLRPRWDPEGILGTLPAIATTLCGVLAGHWLRSPRDQWQRATGLFVAGNAAILLGLIMDAWFPINKNLWTSSFVVFTAGVALAVIGTCYWLIDIKGYRRWATPFVIYGTNPILAYVLSSLMSKVLAVWIVIGPDGSEMPVRRYLFETCFLPLASPHNASLLYAVAYVLLWLGLTAILYRRRIFIKI